MTGQWMIPAGRRGTTPHLVRTWEPNRRPVPPPEGRHRVPCYPAGTVLGYTACGRMITPEDVWVRWTDGNDDARCRTCQQRAPEPVAAAV